MDKSQNKGKFFRVDVEFKNGFKYSYTCIGKMVEGMMKSSESHWTKTIKRTEITEKEHHETRTRK